MQSAAYANVRPWLAVCGLWVLFEAPTIIRSGGVGIRHVRPSADVLVLLTFAALSGRFAARRFVRGLLIAYAALLVLIRLDYVIFMLLMRDEPLLYDQVLMLRHLFVLISDLWSPTVALVVLAVTAGVAVFPWAISRLLRAARPLLDPTRIERTAQVGYVAWLLVLVLSGVHALGFTKTPIVAWLSPNFADNIAHSRRTYAAITEGIRKPAYAELAKIRLPADKRPDVYLLLVESYGRLMFTDPVLKVAHKPRIAAMEARLKGAGWHAATAFSRSSVSGARSWMAEASILLGTPVLHESVYQHLIAHAQRLPHLPSFLAGQGYETILVAAGDRERPGIKASNPYAYQHYLDYATVNYRGPSYGWGIVPDQYSLGVLRERLLSKATRPVFLNVHLQTSHAPWKEIPPIVADFRSLDHAPKAMQRAPEDEGSTEVLRRMRRYKRGGGQASWYMGGLTEELRDGYGRAIDYELALVTEFLMQQSRDALVIVMGDHQPPVIPKRADKFDVPVHVFARHPSLLADFRQQGFVTGMRPPGQAVMGHAGFLSLVARTLVRAARLPGALPPFRPEGVALLPE